MRVKCNNCSKSFKIDPSKITRPKQKVKCPACGQAILISKPEPASFGDLSLDLSTDDLSGFKQLDLDRLHDGFQPSDGDGDSSIWGEPAGSSDSNPIGLAFDGQDLGLFDRLNPDQLDSALGDPASDYHQAAFESDLSLEIGDINPEIVDEGVEAQDPEKTPVTQKTAEPESVVVVGLVQIKGKLSVCLRCPDCRAASRIEYKKIPDEGLTVKCKKCGRKLPVKRPSHPGPAWDRRQKGDQYEIYGWPEIYFRAMGLMEDQPETPAPEPEPVSEAPPALAEVAVEIPPSRQVVSPPPVAESMEPPVSEAAASTAKAAETIFDELAAPVASPEPSAVETTPAEVVFLETPESRLEQEAIPPVVEEAIFPAVASAESAPAETVFPEPSPPELPVAPEDVSAVETEAPPALEVSGPEPSFAPEESVTREEPALEEPTPSESEEAELPELAVSELPAAGEAAEIPLAMEAGPSEPAAPDVPVFDSPPEETVPPVEAAPVIEEAIALDTLAAEPEPLEETSLPEPVTPEPMSIPEIMEPPVEAFPETPVIVEAAVEPPAEEPEPSPVPEFQAVEPTAEIEAPIAFIPTLETGPAEPAGSPETILPDITLPEEAPSVVGPETALAETVEAVASPTTELATEEVPAVSMIHAEAPVPEPESPQEPASTDESGDSETTSAPAETFSLVEEPTVSEAIEDQAIPDAPFIEIPESPTGEAPDAVSISEPLPAEVEAGPDTVPAQLDLFGEPLVSVPVESPGRPESELPLALEAAPPAFETPLLAALLAAEEFQAARETSAEVAATPPSAETSFPEPAEAAPWEPPRAVEPASPALYVDEPELVRPETMAPEAVPAAPPLPVEPINEDRAAEPIVLESQPAPEALPESPAMEAPQPLPEEPTAAPVSELAVPVPEPEPLPDIPMAFVSEPVQADTAPEIEQAAKAEPTPEAQLPEPAPIPEPLRPVESLAHLEASASEEPPIQVEPGPAAVLIEPAPTPSEPIPLQPEAVVAPAVEPLVAPMAETGGIEILEEEEPAVLAEIVEAPEAPETPETADSGSGIDLAAVAGIGTDMPAPPTSSARLGPEKVEAVPAESDEPEDEISLADVLEEAKRESAPAPEVPVSPPAGKLGAEKARPEKVVSLEPSTKAKAKKEAIPAPAPTPAEPAKPQFRYVEEPRVKKGAVVKIIGVLILLGIVGGLVYFLPSYFSDMKIRNERQAALTGYEPLKFLADAIAAKQEYAEYSTGVIKAEMTLKKKESEFGGQNQLVEIYSLYKLADQMWESVLYKDAEQLSKAFEQACLKAREIEKVDSSSETAGLIAAAGPGCVPGALKDVFKDPNPSRARQLQWVDAAKQLLWRQAAQRLARFEKEVLTPLSPQ